MQRLYTYGLWLTQNREFINANVAKSAKKREFLLEISEIRLIRAIRVRVAPQQRRLVKRLGEDHSLRVGLIQPIERIHLYAVDPHFPMQMRAGDPAGPAHQADHLTLFDHIPNIHQHL